MWEAWEVGCCMQFLVGQGRQSPTCYGCHTRFPIVVACHECQGGHVPGPHPRKRAGVTSPARAAVPAIPDAGESGDVGAIFILFLLHVHDKGLKGDTQKERLPPIELSLRLS